MIFYIINQLKIILCMNFKIMTIKVNNFYSLSYKKTIDENITFLTFLVYSN